MNLMELIAEESAFDHPCKHGNRVECHAVYCNNMEWKDAPRKCRRTWYTGGEVRDEDCPGFAPNESAPPAPTGSAAGKEGDSHD
jgi:hypothetical protein